MTVVGFFLGYSRGFGDGEVQGEQVGRVRTLIEEGYSLREISIRLQSNPENLEGY